MEIIENLGNHTTFASKYLEERSNSSVNKSASLYYLQAFESAPELDEEIFVSDTFVVHSVGNQLQHCMNLDSGWGSVREVFFIDFSIGTYSHPGGDSSLSRCLCIFFDNLIHIFSNGETYLVHLPFILSKAWPLKNCVFLKKSNENFFETEAQFYLLEHPLEDVKKVILDSASSSDEFISHLTSLENQIVQVFNKPQCYILTYNFISKCHTLWEYENHSSVYTSQNKKLKLSDPNDFFLSEFKNQSAQLDYKNVVIGFKKVWTEPPSLKGPRALKAYFLKRLHNQLVLCLFKENFLLNMYDISNKVSSSLVFESEASDIIPVSTLHPDQQDLVILTNSHLFLWIGERTLLKLNSPFTEHSISKLDHSRLSRFNVYCEISRCWFELKIKGLFYSTLAKKSFELISLVTPQSFSCRLHETLLHKPTLLDWPRFVVSLVSLFIKPNKSHVNKEYCTDEILIERKIPISNLKSLNLSNLIEFCSEASKLDLVQELDITIVASVIMILHLLHQEYRILQFHKTESRELFHLLGMLTISCGEKVFHEYYFLDAPDSLVCELSKYFGHLVFDPSLLELGCIYRIIYKHILNGFVSRYCLIKEVPILQDRICKSSIEIEISLKKILPNLMEMCGFLNGASKTPILMDNQLSTLDPCLQIILGDMINGSLSKTGSVISEKHPEQLDQYNNLLDVSLCFKLSQKANLASEPWLNNGSISFPPNLSGKVVNETYIPSEGPGKLWESSQIRKFLDYRFSEVENLLTSFKEHCIISDQSITSETKKALVNNHGSFIEGLVCGRIFGLGLFRFRTFATTIIDPKNWLSVHGEFLFEDDSFVIKVDENLPWIQFHQGVLTGLQYVSISPSCLLPRADLTRYQIGGYLFGLGLAGRLQDLSDLALYQLILPNDPPSNVGLLLGKAVSKFASCDQKTSTLLKIKTKTISAESVVSLLGIGLVNFGSCDRQLINLALDQICSEDKSILKQSADFAEAMSIAAGFSLGFIGFGKGPDLANLSSIFSALSVKLDSYAALISLALLFFNTDHPNAVKILLPFQDFGSKYPTFNDLEVEINPLNYFIRIICLDLVQWKSVPTKLGGLPTELFEDQEGLSKVVKLAANCFSVGLYYMGSYHQEAIAYVKKLSDLIRCAVNNSTDLSKRGVYNTLLISSHLAMAMIMAGSADLSVLQYLRLFQRRREPGINYGHASGNSLAIGLLFCGEGHFCFSSANGPQLALAFLAFFPIFSASPHEDFCPFPQLFRHFWAMCLKSKPSIPTTLSKSTKDLSLKRNVHVTPSSNYSNYLKTVSFFNPDVYTTYFPGPKHVHFKSVYTHYKLEQLALLNLYLPYSQEFPLPFKSHIISLYQYWKQSLSSELKELPCNLSNTHPSSNTVSKMAILQYKYFHFLPSFSVSKGTNLFVTNIHSLFDRNDNFNELINLPLPPYNQSSR